GYADMYTKKGPPPVFASVAAFPSPVNTPAGMVTERGKVIHPWRRADFRLTSLPSWRADSARGSRRCLDLPTHPTLGHGPFWNDQHTHLWFNRFNQHADAMKLCLLPVLLGLVMSSVIHAQVSTDNPRIVIDDVDLKGAVQLRLPVTDGEDLRFSHLSTKAG